MKPPKLRWGLLSTAHINRAIIPPLRTSPRNTLAAVASRTVENAQAYAKEHKIPHAHGSYEALLDDPEIDVIYVSLPNHLHAEWAIRALQAGKHVLCEKPLAISVAQVDAIAAAASKAGKIIAEAFMYRHHPQTIKVKEMVSSGLIGQVLLIRGAFSYNLTRQNNVRLDPAMGGGSLWDVGCYPLSYARYLLEAEPEEVFAWENININGIDDVLVAQARFPAGASGKVYAQFDSSFCLAHRSFMEIVGTTGALYIPAPYKPGKGENLYLHRSDGSSETIRIPGSELYIGEVEDMADAILLGKAPRVSLADSRGNVAAICALYEFARSHQPVLLK